MPLHAESGVLPHRVQGPSHDPARHRVAISVKEGEPVPWIDVPVRPAMGVGGRKAVCDDGQQLHHWVQESALRIEMRRLSDVRRRAVRRLSAEDELLHHEVQEDVCGGQVNVAMMVGANVVPQAALRMGIQRTWSRSRCWYREQYAGRMGVGMAESVTCALSINRGIDFSRGRIHARSESVAMSTEPRMYLDGVLVERHFAASRTTGSTSCAWPCSRSAPRSRRRNE